MTNEFNILILQTLLSYQRSLNGNVRSLEVQFRLTHSNIHRFCTHKQVDKFHVRIIAYITLLFY